MRQAFLLLMLWLVMLPLQADSHRVFEVKSASTQLNGSVYFLNAAFDIVLPLFMVDALEKGFDLPLAMEVEVHEEHRYWLNREIARIKQQYIVQYHTLLDTVSVLDVNAGRVHYYATLPEAMTGLSALLNYPLLDNHALEKDQRYVARLRIGVDEAELPVPLKTQVPGQNDWDLVSDWFSWEINP